MIQHKEKKKEIMNHIQRNKNCCSKSSMRYQKRKKLVFLVINKCFLSRNKRRRIHFVILSYFKINPKHYQNFPKIIN